MVATSSNSAVRSRIALAMDVAACNDVAPLMTKVATQGHRQMDQAPGTKGHRGEIIETLYFVFLGVADLPGGKSIRRRCRRRKEGRSCRQGHVSSLWLSTGKGV